MPYLQLAKLLLTRRNQFLPYSCVEERTSRTSSFHFPSQSYSTPFFSNFIPHHVPSPSTHMEPRPRPGNQSRFSTNLQAVPRSAYQTQVPPTWADQHFRCREKRFESGAFSSGEGGNGQEEEGGGVAAFGAVGVPAGWAVEDRRSEGRGGG